MEFMSRQGAGRVGLDEDIGRVQEFVEPFPSGGGGDVEGNPPLPGVPHGEVQARWTIRGAVSDARPVDLWDEGR